MPISGLRAFAYGKWAQDPFSEVRVMTIPRFSAGRCPAFFLQSSPYCIRWRVFVEACTVSGANQKGAWCSLNC